MKQSTKSTDPKRTLRLNGKKKANSKISVRKDSASPQKSREEIEPEAEQARHKKAKGK